MTELLKCCPFCGGEARLQRWRKKSDYYVICKKCGCRTPLFQYQFDSKEERRNDAINAWNTRKPVQDVLKQLKTKINTLHNANWNAAIEEAIEIVKEGLK